MERNLLAQVAEMRKENRKKDEKRDAGVDLKPTGIIQQNNLLYGTHQQLCDVYYPAQIDEVRIIVNIHGGGWIYGDKEIYKAYCLRLAQQGFVVVNFNYRLAPEQPFPAAIDDVNELFQWLGQWVTTEPVFIVADSAGAQLALQYVTIQSNESFRELFSYESLSYPISKVALYCGVYFLETSPTINEGRLKDLRKAYLPDEIWQKYDKQLRTENYLTSSIPDLFLATGHEDFLREDTHRLHDYLVEKKIKHQMKDYRSATEEVRHVFELHPNTTVSKQAMNDLMTFLSISFAS